MHLKNNVDRIKSARQDLDLKVKKFSGDIDKLSQKVIDSQDSSIEFLKKAKKNKDDYIKGFDEIMARLL